MYGGGVSRKQVSLYFWQIDTQCPFNRKLGVPEFECECCDREHFVPVLLIFGTSGGVVVEALRYKPEGRGIDSRCLH
jgi:hypothetical protein